MPVSPGSPCDLANDVPLETAANRSAPMMCGPNVDQACPRPVRAAALRVADLGWLGGPPTAPRRERRLIVALLKGHRVL
jgi:hypothetical protein